jgi:hypothetical protein
MPRTTDDPLDRYMRFRCTEAEGERLMRTARRQSLTFSEFARQQLLNARRRRRTTTQFVESVTAAANLASVPDSDAKALAFQIQKVGVNLNQIVKAMHTHQTPAPPDLHELLGEIRQYVRKAQRLPNTHVP